MAQDYAGLDDIPDINPGGSSTIPPDTNGAVGLTKVMEMLNNNYRTRNKSTGATINTVAPSTFWGGVGTVDPFDPRTVYDPINDRWIVAAVSEAESADSSIEIGVSKTSDPDGEYWTFRIDADEGDADWADFPQLGFNKNWVAVNVQMFPNAGGSWSGSKILVVDYPQLRSGTYSGEFLASPDFGAYPAVTLSATEDTLYVPSHWWGSNFYRVLRITGTPSTPVLTVPSCCRSRDVAFAAPIGQAPQAAPISGASSCSATPCTVDSGDQRIGTAPVVRDGFLYYAQAVGLPAGVPTHDGVLWTKLDASTGDVADGGLIEDTTATVSNGGKWYAYPSIAANQDGDVLVGFSQYASNQWPSAGYAMHLAFDAPGTIRDPIIYKAGEDYYHKTFGGTRNRWGDYSVAQVDPSNDTDLWTLQEYAKLRVGTDDGATTSNSSRWGTWWARVTPPPTLPAIDWDPASAGDRIANRPLTCNVPTGSCTDSGRAWTGGASAVAVSNDSSIHYVHAAWTTDAPTGDEGNGAVDHTDACASALDPATGAPPYCSGVYYASSSDAGTTWNGGADGTAPFAVSPTDVHAGRAAIAASGKWVYVAFVTTVGFADAMCANDARVLWIRANDDYGADYAWMDPVRLSPIGGRVDRPVITASGDEVAVIHTNSDSGRILVDRSTDNAASFSTQPIGHTQATFDNGTSPESPTCLGAPTPPGLEGFSGRATVASNGTTLGAAWMSKDSGKAVAKISVDDGVTWPGSGNGSACTGGSGHCTMHLAPAGALGAGGRSLIASAASAGRIAFAWVNDAGTTLPKGLYVRVFTSAAGWAPVRLVSCMQNTGSCAGAPAAALYNDGYSPSVAMYGTTGLGVAWSACPYTPTSPAIPCDRTPSGGSRDPGAEILWKESWNNGVTWSAGEGSGTSYRKVAGNAAVTSTINDRVSVAFGTTSGADAGCHQQVGSVPVGIPGSGCNRYLLFTGQSYDATTTRVNLSIGTQAPG